MPCHARPGAADGEVTVAVHPHPHTRAVIERRTGRAVAIGANFGALVHVHATNVSGYNAAPRLPFSAAQPMSHGAKISRENGVAVALPDPLGEHLDYSAAARLLAVTRTNYLAEHQYPLVTGKHIKQIRTMENEAAWYP